MKRTRRIEIVRYSRRVMTTDAAATPEHETAIAVLSMKVYAPPTPDPAGHRQWAALRAVNP